MILKGLHIEGFGIFHDLQITGLGPGLNIFLGPNEAGKTTLLAFVRQVLFGFPSGRRADGRYVPLRGGRHGGRLFLEVSEGTVVVERLRDGRRQAFKIKWPDGTEGTETDLRRLLGGADERLFRTIFAFDLAELAAFENLQAEGVRDRIFTAGITGAGASARKALQRLEKEARALLAPRSGEIRRQLKAIKELRVRLSEARKEAQTYEKLLLSEDSLKDRQKELGQRREALRTKEARLKRLLDLWPVWRDKKDLEDKLKDLPVVESFPDDGMEKLAGLLEELKQARKKRYELLGELRGVQEELRLRAERLKPELLPLASEAEYVERQGASQLERLRKEADLSARLERARRELQEGLGSLGPGWDEERLGAVDDSVPRQEQISRFAAEVVGARDALRRRLEELSDKVRALERGREELAARKADFEAFQLTAPGLGRGEKFLPFVLSAVLFAAAALSFFSGRYAVAALLLVSGAGTAIFGFFRLLELRRRRVRTEEILKERKASLAASEERLLKAEEEISRDFALLREELSGTGEEGGVEVVSIGELRGRMEEVGRLIGKHGKISCPEKKGHSKTAELLKRWETLRAEAGLPATVTPQSADAFFRQLQVVKERLGRRNDFVEELEAVRKAIKEWETQARGLLARAGRKEEAELSGPDLISAMRDLARACREARNEAENASRLKSEKTRLEKKFESAENEVKEAEERLEALFACAGAQDEEDFRTRHRIFVERRTLKEKIGELERRLSLQLGSDLKLKEELASGRVTAWEEELQSTREALQECEAARDEVIGRLRDVQRDRERLEESADVPAVELELEVARENLRRLLDRWIVLQTASGLIRETLTAFTRTRQPAVLKEASELFKTVTDGLYGRIIVNDRGELEVERRSGEFLQPGALSRGTAEQLYLCLRFALAGEFCRRGSRLPLVLDDVIVNFDPERAEAVAELIGRRASGQQILFFTCHPETEALLRRKAPEGTSFRLERFGRAVRLEEKLSSTDG